MTSLCVSLSGMQRMAVQATSVLKKSSLFTLSKHSKWDHWNNLAKEVRCRDC